MSIHVTLFHGASGWAIGLLSLIGAVSLLWQVECWFGDRLELRLHPFPLSLRVDRPGHWVSLGDGRYGVVQRVIRDRDFGEPMASVQPYDDNQQELPAEWIPVSRLSPIEYEEATA